MSLGPFGEWLQDASLTGGAIGGAAWMMSKLWKSLHKDSLDNSQIDGLKETLNLLRSELTREREERIKERIEWLAREGELKAEMHAVTVSLRAAREQIVTLHDMLYKLKASE